MRNIQCYSMVTLVLLVTTWHLCALEVQRVVIVPPQEKYLYGLKYSSGSLYSSLGRQVFRSMQKGVVLFNKSPMSQKRRIAIQNSGFVVASYKYNRIIEYFYRRISDSISYRNYLNQLMKSQQSQFVIWFEFHENYKNIITSGVFYDRYIEGRIFLFDGSSNYSQNIRLNYKGGTKSFSKYSRNRIADITCGMLLGRLE